MRGNIRQGRIPNPRRLVIWACAELGKASGRTYTEEERRRGGGRRGEGLMPHAATIGSDRTCAEPESCAALPVRAFNHCAPGEGAAV
jgi:hypothetical protein